MLCFSGFELYSRWVPLSTIPRFLSNCVFKLGSTAARVSSMTGICQQSIKIISIENTFTLHKSAQKKTFSPGIFEELMSSI